jgi:hypothetical protein
MPEDNFAVLPDIPATYLLSSGSLALPHRHRTRLDTIPKRYCSRQCHSDTDDSTSSPTASPGPPLLPIHLRGSFSSASATRIPPVCEKFLQRLKPKQQTPAGLHICYSPPIYREGKRRSRSFTSFSEEEDYSSGYESFCADSPHG